MRHDGFYPVDMAFVSIGNMYRKRDAAESGANAIAGLIISMFAVHAAWPVFGWDVNAEQSLSVAALFFCLSTIRAYVIRRIFRRMK